MSLCTQKISVYSLVPGMFVYKLDRPWAETSYPLEGFHIKNHDEIRKLKLICRHVYIDIEKTSHQIQQRLLKAQIDKETNTPRKVSKILRVPNQTRYDTIIPFHKAVKRARKNHQQLRQGIKQIFQQLKKQQIIDLKNIEPVVTQTVENIIANPHGLMWLSRTQQNDQYLYDFVLKQTIWALAAGRCIGLCRQDLYFLAKASLMSVVGKIQLPRKILYKEGFISANEQKMYQQHLLLSLDSVKKMRGIEAQTLNILENYCENVDGSGYPARKTGKQIPLSSQLVALAEYYEQLTTPRNIQRAISPNSAIEQINQQKHIRFDATIAEKFIAAIGIYPAGTLVQLSNGEIGLIMERKSVETSNRLLPDVLILRNRMDEKPKGGKVVHLHRMQQNLRIIQSLPLGSHQIDSKEIQQAIDYQKGSWQQFKQIINF